MMLLLLACSPPPPPEPVRFVRGGVVHADGRVEERAWAPGEDVQGTVAPRIPECVPLFHVELEDRAREAAMGVPAAGAALAFSPDGKKLAIGTAGGAVRVVDGWTGAPLVDRSFAEAAAKRVAWSRDGQTLYVVEQSPDAYLRAVDPVTLADRWTHRLADDLETSVLPPKDDIYGMYSLPSAFGLHVLDDGSLLVAGAHGWTIADGTRQNRSRLYRFAADGAVLAAWPADRAADGILLYPAVEGDTALALLARSADGPDPGDLPIGGAMALDLATLTPRWTTRFSPLEPYFKDVYMWEAGVLAPHAGFVGLGDGRAFVLDRATGAILDTLTPGVPVLTQGVPIATGVGFATGRDGRVYYLTTSTNIPWGSADPSTRPPAAHPAQNTVHALDLPDAPAWSRALEHAVEGVQLAPDGSALAVGAGPRASDERTDLYGAVLLDPATGTTISTCSSEGPVDFRIVWAPDGRRLAVAEAPFLVGGDVHGAYRVTVFR